MLKNIDWPVNQTYSKGTEYEPEEFYLEGLFNSNRFDLLLGYFSSSAINILADGFATFIHKGGKMRLVINHILSKADKEAIIKGLEGQIDDKFIDIADLKGLKQKLDSYGQHFFDCLGWLIKHHRIEIKIIRPKNNINGISHYKSGIFYDSVNAVGFKGSCNFTSFGLTQNLEELDVFFDWKDDSKVVSQIESFEKIFKGEADFADYLDIQEVEVAIKNEFGDKSIQELLVNEAELIKAKQRQTSNPRVKKIRDEILELEDSIANEPHFPFGGSPRPYQVEAYNNWVKNDYKGIFAMATGTGKTITSLNCVLEEYRKKKKYQFIVLVPTIPLASQWESEIVDEFNFVNIISCSSANKEWTKSLKDIVRGSRLGINFNFCLLVTYATFRTNSFQEIFNQIPESCLNEIILIADEAHTLGAKSLTKVLPHMIVKRIGLSATPERQFDDEGEDFVYRYFDSFGPNFTFSYNMKNAIENGVLCQYYYYPVFVSLDNDELTQYKDLTTKLNKFLDVETGKYKDNIIVKELLIKRKNIIHKAKDKKTKLLSIISEIGVENFRQAFIYVPEGFEYNYSSSDKMEEETDDIQLIRIYTKAIYDTFKLKLKEFTGSTKNRDEILDQFKTGKLDALLAMKCLDEGVDIPMTKIAIFCSSTGNPRQYIQRRGRILRNYPGKKYAFVYDMIVKPNVEFMNTDPNRVKLEKNILLNELRRLVNFAVLATNKTECLKNIEEICYGHGIDIYALANAEEQKYL